MGRGAVSDGSDGGGEGGFGGGGGWGMGTMDRLAMDCVMLRTGCGLYC